MDMSLRFSAPGMAPFRLMLDRFGDNIADPRPLFEKIADEFAQDQGDRFARGNSLWTPLEPKYAAWKAARYPGAPVLTRTGALRDSLANRPLDVEWIDTQRMVIGTNLHYAGYHQRGMGNNPVRRMIDDPSPQTLHNYGNLLHEWAFEGVGAS